MANPYKIDPVGRMEGHMGLEFESVVVPSDSAPAQMAPVTKPKSIGTMFRGFENIMLDRQPQEGIQITQRI